MLCTILIYTTGTLKYYEILENTLKGFTLRCKKCSILFNYVIMYGNKEATGFQFHHSEREYDIEVSDTLYFERRLLEWQCSLA